MTAAHILIAETDGFLSLSLSVTFSIHSHIRQSHCMAEITLLWASWPDHMWQRAYVYIYRLYLHRCIHLSMDVYNVCSMPSYHPILTTVVYCIMISLSVLSLTSLARPKYSSQTFNRRLTSPRYLTPSTITHRISFKINTACLQGCICSSIHFWTLVPMPPSRELRSSDQRLLSTQEVRIKHYVDRPSPPSLQNFPQHLFLPNCSVLHMSP